MNLEEIDKIKKSLKKITDKLNNPALKDKKKKKILEKGIKEIKSFVILLQKLGSRPENFGINNMSEHSIKQLEEWETLLSRLEDKDFEEEFQESIKTYAKEFTLSDRKRGIVIPPEIQSELNKAKIIPNYISNRRAEFVVKLRMLEISESNLKKAKLRIEHLKSNIEARTTLFLENHYNELLSFNGIKESHPEIYYFLLISGDDFPLRSKYLPEGLKSLENLIHRENENNGYIKNQHHILLEQVNNYLFKIPGEQEKIVEFLSRFYKIPKIRELIKQFTEFMPLFLKTQRRFNEIEYLEEVELKEKQMWVQKYEPTIQKLRKIIIEEFNELMDIDFYKSKLTKSDLNNT